MKVIRKFLALVKVLLSVQMSNTELDITKHQVLPLENS